MTRGPQQSAAADSMMLTLRSVCPRDLVARWAADVVTGGLAGTAKVSV
jgi:hypothetical protein